MDDLISRQAAIDALWKALYEYEDKTEKQFQESEDLDVGDWILHRIFVQNMSDIDRQTILNLPSAQPVQWIPCSERLPEEPYGCLVTVWDTNPVTMDEFENILPYFVGWDGEQWNDGDGEQCPFEVVAWMPLPEPFHAERSKQ